MEFKTIIEKNDTEEIVNSDCINWNFFKNSSVLITGATGLIGSQIVRALILANELNGTNIKILAHIRNKKKAEEMFGKKAKLKYLICDISDFHRIKEHADFIIHTANSTSPKDFSEKPVETISSIFEGTKNILEYSLMTKPKSVVYLSSMEVYGKTDFNRIEPLKETDLGYIDITIPRSSYPEGKRLAECMCAAYSTEHKVPVKIARLSQTIGAGVNYDDIRVFAQFARNIVEKQDITLKTDGSAIRSYCYVTDAIIAIFSILEKGVNGNCYNVANSNTTCSIKEIAEMLVKKYTTSKLKFELDDRFYPEPSKLYLDTTKLISEIGWMPTISLDEMFSRLIKNFIHVKFSSKNSKLITNFWQNLFILKNIKNKKIVKLMGLTFKINRNKYLKLYKKNIPIENNKIVFCNFKGSGYGCNPKYIAEEILRRKLPYKLVWLTKNATEKQFEFPKEISVIEYDSEDAMKELATAKIWVDNQRKLFHISQGLEKRENQFYIQTWHGSLGIKRLEIDTTNDYSSLGWLPQGIDDAEMTDFVITNSSFEENIFTNRLWTKEKLKKFGHPRNDVFFYNDEKKKLILDKVKTQIGIAGDERIITYMPTFRDNNDMDVYKFDSKKLLEACSARFGGKWKLVLRLHPSLKKESKNGNLYANDILNGAKYSDAQELLAATDILITDYSSCIYDFMLTKKPGFIFAKDIDNYNNERGFYYPLESTPFAIAKNENELYANVLNFNKDKYKCAVEKFLNEKECIDDGHASERIVDLIKEIMER